LIYKLLLFLNEKCVEMMPQKRMSVGSKLGDSLFKMFKNTADQNIIDKDKR